MCLEGEVGGRLSYSAWHPHLLGGASPAVTGPRAPAPRSLNSSGRSWLQGRFPCRSAARPCPRLLCPQDLPLLWAQSVEREIKDSTKTRGQKVPHTAACPWLSESRSGGPTQTGARGRGFAGNRAIRRAACTGKGNAGWLL